MAIAIQPYSADLIPAVRAFNKRLATGGVAPEFHFPESNIPDWLPKLDGRRIYQEYYLAVDGESVRGGFILKFQDFFLAGKLQPVVYYHLPVSEGIINKAYAGVGVHMLRSALKLRPMLFALGMGGFDRPLPQMLQALGWNLCAVPFYFKANHAAKFLREIAPLRQSESRQLLAGLAAFTGAGWAVMKLVDAVRTARPEPALLVEKIDAFSECDDDLWKYFGNLRLGSIVDCLALPADASPVMHGATDFLKQRGVDLTISNQSHHAWGSALRSSGFLKARSNFIFAASKALAELLAPFQSTQNQLFMNRGDGDGPVNL